MTKATLNRALAPLALRKVLAFHLMLSPSSPTLSHNETVNIGKDFFRV